MNGHEPRWVFGQGELSRAVNRDAGRSHSGSCPCRRGRQRTRFIISGGLLHQINAILHSQTMLARDGQEDTTHPHVTEHLNISLAGNVGHGAQDLLTVDVAITLITQTTVKRRGACVLIDPTAGAQDSLLPRDVHTPLVDKALKHIPIDVNNRKVRTNKGLRGSVCHLHVSPQNAAILPLERVKLTTGGTGAWTEELVLVLEHAGIEGTCGCRLGHGDVLR